jgi:competence protein ComEA
MLTTDEIKALALLVALALLGAGLAQLDARNPRVLTLTLGDSLLLGRAAPEPESGEMPAAALAPGASSADLKAAPPSHPDSSASAVDVTGRIDVNTASAVELELLPGVGPKMAERIVEERTRHGRFRRPRDLRRVKGIGEKTLARLLPYVRTDSATESAR